MCIVLGHKICGKVGQRQPEANTVTKHAEGVRVGAGPQCLPCMRLDAQPPLGAHLTARAGEDTNLPCLALPGTLTCSKYISYCFTLIVSSYGPAKARSRFSRVNEGAEGHALPGWVAPRLVPGSLHSAFPPQTGAQAPKL